MKYYVFDPMVLRKSLNPLQEVGVMKSKNGNSILIFDLS